MDITSPPLALSGFQGLAGRNLIRSGNGIINQRVVSGTVTLAAGAYGHDGFKGGANGCTYTFATSGVDTVFTISAGSLLQVIESASVFTSSVWLGWFGTSTARIWQGSASGTYAAGSPLAMRTGTINTLLVTGLSLATATSVEFSTGTLGFVQCEEAIPGVGPTPFERRHPAIDLALCQRYYESGNVSLLASSAASGNFLSLYVPFKVSKRGAPTMGFTLTYNYNSSGATIDFSAVDAFRIYTSSTAAAANIQMTGLYTASSEL